MSCCRRQRNSEQEVNQRVTRHKQRAIALVEPKHHESVDSAIYDVIDYDQINSQPANLESFQTDTYNSYKNSPESLYLTPRLTCNQPPDNYVRLDVAAANHVANVSDLAPCEAPHSPPPAYTPSTFFSRSSI